MLPASFCTGQMTLPDPLENRVWELPEDKQDPTFNGNDNPIMQGSFSLSGSVLIWTALSELTPLPAGSSLHSACLVTCCPCTGRYSGERRRESSLEDISDCSLQPYLALSRREGSAAGRCGGKHILREAFRRVLPPSAFFQGADTLSAGAIVC